MAPKSSSMRRRLRRRDRNRDALLVEESATELQTTSGLADYIMPPADARSGAQYHGRESYSHFQPESYSPDEPLLEPDDAQAHALGHETRRSGFAVYASSSSSPTDKNKPVLSASSTSANIIDALMPDRPILKRLPRRTASVCSSSDLKETDAEITLLPYRPALDRLPRRTASVCSSYQQKDTHAKAILALDLKGQDYKPDEAGEYPCHSQAHRPECPECKKLHPCLLAIVRRKRETIDEEHSSLWAFTDA